MKKRILLSTILSAALLLSVLLFSPSESISAKSETDVTKDTFDKRTAKNIIKSALKVLKETPGISFYYTSVTNYSKYDNRVTSYRYINGYSTSKYDYYMAFDKTELERAWIGYNVNGKVYRKGFSDSVFRVYDNTANYTAQAGTDKLYLEYMLSNLKSVKLSNISFKNYVITAKPNWENSDVASITLTINKKTKRIVKIRCKKAKKTYSYMNANDSYTVTGGTFTYSKIGYGDFTISIPDEIIEAPIVEYPEGG